VQKGGKDGQRGPKRSNKKSQARCTNRGAGVSRKEDGGKVRENHTANQPRDKKICRGAGGMQKKREWIKKNKEQENGIPFAVQWGKVRSYNRAGLRGERGRKGGEKKGHLKTHNYRPGRRTKRKVHQSRKTKNGDPRGAVVGGCQNRRVATPQGGK